MFSRNTFWRVLAAFFGLFFLLTLASQFVFQRFEGRRITFYEALLFVGETLSTTGYGEQLPFRSPVLVIWTLFLMGVGVLVVAVWLTTLAGTWFTTWVMPQPPRRAPRRLTGHVVICGTGPVGRFLGEEFQEAGIAYLMLDHRRVPLEEAMRAGHQVMAGDPRTAEILLTTNLAECRALVACMTDPDNASIALVARALRADLPIYCTAEHAENEEFLYAAGATQVVSAKRTLGERLGWLSTAPLSGQLDRLWHPVEGLHFCQVPVLPGSGLSAPSLRDAKVRERTGATVLGMWSHGHFVPVLRPDMPLRSGNVLIAAGRPDEIDRLRQLSQVQARPIAAQAEVLVLGSGDVGWAAIQALRQKEIPFRGLSLRVEPDQAGFIAGDATDRSDLFDAGITEVGRCIVALDDDSRAVFATLAARQMNPGLRIVARANSLETVARLYLAGADNVLSVSEVAGTQLARLVLPEGLALPTLDELNTLELEVPGALAGKTLAEGHVSKRTGCIVLAVRPPGKDLEVNPPARRRLARGELLVLFGTREQFERFENTYGA